MSRRNILTIVVVLLICIPLTAQTKKKRPLPYEYGRVVIDNYSERSNMAPVVFEHWIHRSRFTCRVCHVDVGFAMKAGTTGIRAVDNERGFYCGACHNGKLMVNGKPLFQSCAYEETAENRQRCDRCHSEGKNVVPSVDFFQFTEPLPKERFGNGIDWEKAENMGLIKPATELEGFSNRRKLMAVQKDFALNSKVEGMPDIIFSHQKHTVWNGCELCHPEIFVGVKRGNSHYSMVDISEGKSCGACHVTVAFPLTDCQRCHTKPVQP